MEEEEVTDREVHLAMLHRELDKIRKYLNEDDTDRINQVIGSNSPDSCLTSSEKKADPGLDRNHLQSRTVDKENIPVSSLNTLHKPAQHASEFEKNGRKSDGTGEFQLSSIFGSGTEPSCGSSDGSLPGWSSGSHRKRTVGLPGRVPVVHPIPELADDDDGYGKASFSLPGRVPVVHPVPELAGHDGDGKSLLKSDSFIVPSSLSRQNSGSSSSAMLSLKFAMKKTPPDVCPEARCGKEQAAVHSAATLLHRRDWGDTSRMGDLTSTFNRVANTPESCRDFLLSLEKSGDPRTDEALLARLRAYYDRVFSRLPVEKYGENETYAKILVRYAELKGIEDSDQARDYFVVARSYCKYFACVHIAHAQFEVSQGNIKKATSILMKGQALNARPSRLLEVALRNIQAGEKILIPAWEEEEKEMEKEEHPGGGVQPQSRALPAAAACESQEGPGFARTSARAATPRAAHQPMAELPKPVSREAVSREAVSREAAVPAWKMPSLANRRVSPQETRTSPPEPRPTVPRLLASIPTPALLVPARIHPPPTICQTPNNKREPYANSFVTPSVRRDPPPDVASSAPRGGAMPQPPCTPVNQVSYPHTPQNAMLALSNESITINGKQFFVLKIIGRGGSSKVYQVLDHKKQLYAVKYVNLEEADPQTVESYKNEIEHLNHLQQYSDQIIKLYDYEITDSYIYMLMECGNLDLNTWLRNRKSVVPLERKFYWKNMLDAVHTIHKHGIVHSDLKPANFVIVNASLKLIDFGIANCIQPDVTSIMKDSQVGTLNYMPPEAINGRPTQPGKPGSKISPKGDVWSLGCILYCMTYGRTPFQSITNQIAKLHAIIDPSHRIEFPDVAEVDLLDVLKKCLVRDPRERISIAELLDHSYLQVQPQALPEPEPQSHSDLQRILMDLAALNSPNSIVRAANNLAKMCSSGRRLDVAECVKSSSQLSWKM